MDVHMHNSRTVHYGLNNCAEDDLQFLSLEERECILFFEETIGSLEDDDERTGTFAGRHRLEVERPASYTAARHPSPVDHDIIDLVHTTPEPSKHKDELPSMPDFQELVALPETHVQVKANRDSPANVHVSDGESEEVRHQPPAGSVPTPVVIASKIAEHQGTGSTSASQLLQRRASLELPQNPSTKHGPPTHAKPTRLPDSISMLLGSREHIPHSIATEAVAVQERRAQVLANLTGAEHPLDGGEPRCVRNLPMRSISFRDPTPDKSRMEALSKLGLAQRRAQSVVHPSPRVTTVENKQPMQATTRRGSTENTSLKFNLPTNANNNIQATDTTDHCQPKSSPAPVLTSAEVTHSEFNSFGGKSITLNPMMSFRAEYVSTSVPKTEASDIQLNSFGGRSRVLSLTEPNHGARSKTFIPDNSSSNRLSNEDLASRKPEAPANRSAQHPPTPAPRPLHQQSPLSRTPSRAAPPSAELRRKSLPKPSFRTQGITVQFSGKGATDEARRDALRKLGLLRDTS